MRRLSVSCRLAIAARMLDPLSIARDRLAKAESRVQRLEKQLEGARAERDDLQTTVRVMAEITGETAADGPVAEIQGRQKDILRLLPDEPAKGAAPAALYDMYKLICDEDITLDTFRTTTWRMKGNVFVLPHHGRYLVKANDGKYWKEAIAKEEASDAQTSEASKKLGPLGGERGFPPTAPEGSIPSGSTRAQPAAFDAELDDDVPF